MKIKEVVVVIFTIALIVGIIISFWVISIQDLTNKETLLISIILAICSILATWVAADYYGKISLKEIQAEYQENIKMFAIKAAEKVFNLSNELDRLNYFLKSTIDIRDEDIEKVIHSYRERTKASIHIVDTLRIGS